MKVAIIGSREIKTKNIDKYIPKDITLLISGGANGIDMLAERYADKNGIPKLIFKPDYRKFGKNAPLIRNKHIVDYADFVIAVWNGKSSGTKYTIDYARKTGKEVKIILIDITGTEIIPGNLGKDCFGNGKYFDEYGEMIFCCEECDYFMCCFPPAGTQGCAGCTDVYCPKYAPFSSYLR